MFNKKQFVSVLISVLICVFVVCAIVYATTTIGDKITIQSTTNATDAFVVASSGWVSGDDYGPTLYVDTVNGKVGIGMPSVETPLEVYGSVVLGGGAVNKRTEVFYTNSSTNITSTLSSTLLVTNYDTTDNTVAAVNFSSQFTGSGGTSLKGLPSAGIGAQFLAHNDTDGFIWPTDLYFWTGYGALTGGAERMRIKAEGYVGIGTTLPSTELSLVGTASISEDLWASGSFQFGGGEGIATTSYSRLGSAATGHLLSDADDLMISGELEVNETAYFDGLVSASDTNGMMVGGGAKFFGGTASPDFNCTGGSLYIRSGTDNEDTSFYLCNPTNTWNAINFTSL